MIWTITRTNADGTSAPVQTLDDTLQQPGGAITVLQTADAASGLYTTPADWAAYQTALATYQSAMLAYPDAVAAAAALSPPGPVPTAPVAPTAPTLPACPTYQASGLAPGQTPLAPQTVITTRAFLTRFSPTVLTTIATALPTTPALFIWFAKLEGASWVDLTDPETNAGVQALVAAGLLTQADATTILALT